MLLFFCHYMMVFLGECFMKQGLFGGSGGHGNGNGGSGGQRGGGGGSTGGGSGTRGR